MKRVLMIAYHFPPLAGSSGIQRTLRFVQHLPACGWEPLVLTAAPRAYERTSEDLLADVPAGTVMKRAFALDTARHLAVGGRYVGRMARPDRWISWKFDGIRTGMKMIRDFQPQAIWSTYPIATAHVIGAELHRRSGLPWLADFRDPMAQEGYPSDPATWRSFKEIEERAVGHASASIFTTPSAARLYRERYPSMADRIMVLENGYDEETFVCAEQTCPREAITPGTITLLHSGIVYPEERDPTQLFAALQQLKNSGALNSAPLQVRFRAPVHDELLAKLADTYGVADLIEICPPIPYKEALSEMLRADGLLILQAANCNEQIPAKIYEYLRARRPILGLTDPRGDTAGLLRDAGQPWVAPLDSAPAIAALLSDAIRNLQDGTPPHADDDYIAAASRGGRTRALATILDNCIRSPSHRSHC